MTYRIIQGDVRSALWALPEAHFHCAVTSPPYWGLRDYGVAGQIGLEPSIDAYVAAMVNVFREVRRVLRKDGTLWLNLGSSYATNGGAHGGRDDNQRGVGAKRTHDAGGGDQAARRAPGGLKPKDLCGIPWRVAFALQADGWWLRQDIIWHKPSPMPESCTDRCTRAHDYVFLMTKSAHYYYDQDAIREKTGNEATPEEYAEAFGSNEGADADREGEGYRKRSPGLTHPLGRNRRDVWTIPTHGYSGAHFATFPPALPELCIRAGTSMMGCCPKCGAPWTRITEPRGPYAEALKQKTWASGGLAKGHVMPASTPKVTIERETIGWRPTCRCPGLDGDHPGDDFPGCNDEDNWPRVPCRVLDPFVGAGTTCLVAQRLGRDSVGIELNPEYVALAEKRIRGERPLLNGG